MADDFEVLEIKPSLDEALKQTTGRVPNDWLLKPMLESGEFLRAKIVREIHSRAKEPKGDLWRSYQVELIDKGDEEVSVGVFSDLVYAEIQDEGGTIRAKKKYLAIPFKDAKSEIGVRWPRDFSKGELSFAKGKKVGTAYLFKGDKLMFVLKERVEIPGLDYLDPALAAYDKDVEKRLDQHIGLSFKKAGFE